MNDSSNFWEDLKSGRFASMVRESSKGQTVSNSAEVYNILKPMVANHDDVEVLYGIFLDAKNHIIDIQELSRGTLTASAVYPREIIKKVIILKAAALVLAHNHPSGDTTPSAEDREITARVGLVLHSMGVALHDHTIIGNGHHSMADSGWLRQAQSKFHEAITRICC
jgi:DNA repair protein RadC